MIDCDQKFDLGLEVGNSTEEPLAGAWEVSAAFYYPETPRSFCDGRFMPGSPWDQMQSAAMGWACMAADQEGVASNQDRGKAFFQRKKGAE